MFDKKIFLSFMSNSYPCGISLFKFIHQYEFIFLFSEACDFVKFGPFSLIEFLWLAVGDPCIAKGNGMVSLMCDSVSSVDVSCLGYR